MTYTRYCPNCDKEVEPETDKVEITVYTGNEFDVRIEWCPECEGQPHVFDQATWVE